MKWIIFACLIITAVACSSWNFAQRKKTPPPPPSPPAQKLPTLEDKLATLKKCGIGLTPPYTVKDLLDDSDREALENPGYDELLIELGAEEEEPYRKLSANVWYFDTEAISEPGDYKLIAERMMEMTQGSLILQDIKDYVDLDKSEAWLSFTFNRRPIKMNLAVNDDWVDAAVFRKFVELLKEADPSKIYLYYDLGGQDCVFGCVKKTEYECLRSQGVKFVPLSDRQQL
jgi:hypothetical protein